MLSYIHPATHQKIRPFLEKIPVDVNAIAENLGINIFYSELPTGVSGMLIRNDKFEQPGTPSPSDWSTIISFNDSHRRKRFTIAHEIGHFIMHRNLPELQDGVLEDSVFYRSELGSHYETEANRFAADLLMPIDKVMAAYHLNPDIKALANMFDVSEASMKIRIEFCEKIAA